MSNSWVPPELDEEILIGVLAADSTEILLAGALGDGQGQQDLCNPSIDFPAPATFAENPYFSAKSDELILEIDGSQIVLEDMEFSGAFSPDATQIRGAVLVGTADTRSMVELISPGGGDNAICDILKVFLARCEPCADGTGAFCSTMYIDNMRADQASGGALIAWTEADVAGLPENECLPATDTGTL